MEFMSLFDTQNSSAPISWEEFQAVHHDWSANFSKDEDWENAMHSASTLHGNAEIWLNIISVHKMIINKRAFRFSKIEYKKNAVVNFNSNKLHHKVLEFETADLI